MDLCVCLRQIKKTSKNLFLSQKCILGGSLVFKEGLEKKSLWVCLGLFVGVKKPLIGEFMKGMTMRAMMIRESNDTIHSSISFTRFSRSRTGLRAKPLKS
jgi:hypothetical protein